MGAPVRNDRTALVQVALHGSMLPERWTDRHTGVMHERDKGAGVLPGPGRFAPPLTPFNQIEAC